jgi:hypothetical protein
VLFLLVLGGARGRGKRRGEEGEGGEEQGRETTGKGKEWRRGGDSSSLVRTAETSMILRQLLLRVYDALYYYALILKPSLDSYCCVCTTPFTTTL